MGGITAISPLDEFHANRSRARHESNSILG
jgi:hypothetical protein